MTPTDQAVKTAKLIMVTANNNNKFYEMRDNGDGTFTASYGRVGNKATVRRYSMRLWDRKYREKVAKGYKDQTHLFADNKKEVKYVDIADKNVERLMNLLMQYANKSIDTNYVVSADQVSKRQVEEAQALLDNLVAWATMGMNVQQFNNALLDLYQVIPRRMAHVTEHLISIPRTANDLTAVKTKLAEEQATLDVMRGQVALNAKTKEQEVETKEINLLETMGLDVNHVTNMSVIDKIKELMQTEANKFANAYEIVNHKTQTSFDTWLHQKENKKLELFWHGSRNENWMSILETGLVLRPANAVITGKMFGYGLYFADKFKKSLNYSSLRGSYWTSGKSNRGFLALFDVHVGEQLHIKHHNSTCYELNEQNLKKRGTKYDSVFAEGGADLINNEYIVYNQSQCTVKYLVEVN